MGESFFAGEIFRLIDLRVGHGQPLYKTEEIVAIGFDPGAA